VTVAKNVLPVAAGYGPAPSLLTTGESALSERARGYISGLDAAGNAYNFAGSATKLWRIASAGTEDISKTGGYSATDYLRWEFLQFGQDILAVSPRDPIQYVNLRESQFGDLSDDAPQATHIGNVGEFVIVGNTYDTTDGAVPNRIWWPAITNPFSWPTPGTDLAVAVQSDYSDLEGNGGWVNAIVSGSEVGAVFQERAIWRMDYAGGGVIFQLNRVEPTRGALIPGLAIPFGREVIYYAEDGWQRFDYTASQPIGKEVVDRFFKADLDFENLDRVSWVVNPDRTQILIGYVSNDSSDGEPNRILVYDYALNQFSLLYVDHELLATYLPPGPHLDSTPDDTLDAAPFATTSFDDRPSGPGELVYGAYDTAHVLNTFEGASLEAMIETGHVEVFAGRRAFVSRARPLVFGAEATMRAKGLTGSHNTDKKAAYGKTVPQARDGACPIRLDARYHQFKTTIAAGGFDEAVGIDVEAQDSGSL
jgi:hypothetical protein